MLAKPIKKAAKKLDRTMWTSKFIKVNLIKPEQNPRPNIVIMAFLGTLNNMPNPAAATADQKETSNKFNIKSVILI